MGETKAGENYFESNNEYFPFYFHLTIDCHLYGTDGLDVIYETVIPGLESENYLTFRQNDYPGIPRLLYIML